MQRIKGLSLFFPAFNEEENIEKLLKEADIFLKKIAVEFELVVINDGSSDGTGKLVKRLQRENKNIKLVNHPKNLGYGAALKTGFASCRFPWIAFMDSDGQFDIRELKKFLDKKERADLLMGFRIKREDNLFRRFLAKILYFVDWFLFGLKVRDVDCGFKLFKKEILDKIGKLRTESAITETEFVVRAKNAGFRIQEIGVKHRARDKGEQTGGKFKIVSKAALEGLWLRLILCYEDLKKGFFQIKKFIRENKKESVILFLILLLAAFLRLFRIKSHLIFLGDEGRDALVVRNMIVNHKFTLLGPTASVGGFYLGPIYYYMMILPLWLANFDPVGPAVMMAFFGVLTVFLVWLLARDFLGKTAGLVVTLLYAISAKTVYWTRFSWNPNPMPFFSTLLIFLLYKGIKTEKKNFFFLAGCCLGVLWQLHYLSLSLVSVLMGVIFFLVKRKYWLRSIVASFLGTIVTFSPFLFFELRHSFPNTRTIFDFFVQRSGAVQGFDLGYFYYSFKINTFHLVQIILMIENWTIIKIAFLFSLFLLLIRVFKEKNRLASLIFIWWFLGTLTLSLYNGQTYEYYYGFLFPLPIFFFGVTTFFFLKRNWFSRSLIFFLTITLLVLNLREQPALSREGPNLIKQTKKISQMVIDLSDNKPFNFALMATGNSDHSYRYFLELQGRKPLTLEEEVTEQLVVVCEEKECQPLGYPLWEVAGFGRAEIDKIEEHPVGIKVIRLIHHQDTIDYIGKPAPKGT